MVDLVRHPTGSAVIGALWDRAPSEMRDAMASTFYGKEFSVLSQVRLCATRAVMIC